jgi:hypothetical protein
MRSLTLVLVLSACAVFAASTDLAGGVEYGGAAAYLPAESSNGFLDVLYETTAYAPGIPNGTATAPSYGWISVDDFILDEDSNIEKITYWILQNSPASGIYHRFWTDTGGSGPGSELDNADVTATLTSTGSYEFGYLVYKMEAEMDYDLEAGHYWAGSYFPSGFWYMCITYNSWDEMEYFDYGGGGSGPWYTSQYMWGSAYAFFQIIEGVGGWTPPVPYVDGMDPDDGDDEVPLDVYIIFHCKDDGHPIDTDTIVFTVEDQSRRPGRGAPVSDSALTAGRVNPRPTGDISGNLDIDDTDPMDILCTFDPDSDLPVDLITCTVAAGLADSKGNEMADDFIWTFSTGNYGVEQRSWGAIKAEF